MNRPTEDPRRPRYHLTPTVGWINDPYGVVHLAGRYLLFCQYDPDRVHWTPGLSWGVAESADLVHWSPLRTALRPSSTAYGCWSGTAVVQAGRPVLVYTRVDAAPGRHDVGQIVLARPDGDGWVSEPEPVIAGPPPGVDVRHFRDPHLTRTADGWRMLVGAGLDPATGAVLGYRSPDLRHWEFTGVVCSRPLDAPGPVCTGTVWECPQLIELAGRWVLVVSVGCDQPVHVVAATGSFDGTTFRPGQFHRLGHGAAPYATTTFLDAAGRRCAMSWLREPAPSTGDWVGALSLPAVLELVGDRVVARPHPVLDRLRGDPTDSIGPYADLVLGATGRAELDLGSLRLVADAATDQLRLIQPGRPEQPMPLGAAADGSFEVRVVVDGSVAEVYTPGGLAGLRIDPVPAGRLTVPTGVQVTCYPLVG